MSKVADTTANRIKEDILSLLFELYYKETPNTFEISKQLARSKNFVFRLLKELESSGLVSSKREHPGRGWECTWRLTEKSLLAFNKVT